MALSFQETPAKHSFQQDPLTQLASQQHKSVFDALSYSAAIKNPSSVQIVLPELESLQISSLSDTEDTKLTIARRRRRNNKSAAQVALATKIEQYSTDFVIAAPSIPEFKTDKITALNAKLVTFFTACEENFQEIGPGIYILPNYTVTTLQKSPVIVTYHNFRWTCMCKDKTTHKLYVGAHCLHEEFLIKRICLYLQRHVQLLSGFNSSAVTADAEEKSMNVNFVVDDESIAQTINDDCDEVIQPVVNPKLAVAGFCDEFFVSIDSAHLPECILNKHLNSTSQSYEYLVKFLDLPIAFASWVPSKDLPRGMIRRFEETRVTLMQQQRHKADWFPFGEDFIVQWKTHPFFIVPYGAGQLNKFCIVGLDKTGQKLVCKHTSEPHHAHHQAHSNRAKIQLQSLHLRICNKKFVTANEYAEMTQLPEPIVLSVKPAKPISKQLISLIAPPHVQEAIRHHHRGSPSFPLSFKPTTHPQFCKCFSDEQPQGGRYKIAPERLPFNTTLWIAEGPPVSNLSIYKWCCENNNPACEINYDGADDGIFNYSQKTLISHVILWEFLFSMITGRGNTFDGYVRQKHHMNTFIFPFQTESQVLFLQKPTFVKAFKGFLALIPHEYKPLYCTLCGDYPQWLDFDGVSLGMSKTMVNWDSVEFIYPRDDSTVPVSSTVLPSAKRLLIPTQHTRDLLAQFCTASPKAMNNEQFRSLCTALHKDCPALETALLYLEKQEQQLSHPHEIYNYCFPGLWKDFLLLLSTPTSVAWLFRPKVIPLLLHMIETSTYNEACHQQLASYCPALSSVLVHSNGEIPSALLGVIQVMINVVKKTYSKMQFKATAPSSVWHLPSMKALANNQLSSINSTTMQHIAQQAQHNTPFLTGTTKAEALKGEKILPAKDPLLSGVVWHWDQVRELPRVKGVDPQPSTSATSDPQQWADTGATAEEIEALPYCAKTENNTYATRKQTAGLFVGCCPHGNAYGFHCMLAPEGRKDLMKVLYERMPQVVLDKLHVVYDFNCQEAEYMLNRFPDMFQNIRLLIDRFHGVSHKCAFAFKMQSYSDLQELVSNASESLNHFLQRLHEQAAFMKQDLYIALVHTCLGLRNYLNNMLYITQKK